MTETLLESPFEESPFVPGSRYQWAWDSTSLGWLKECPRKYQYHMLEGWRPGGEAVHLEFGIHYHSALERYQKLRFQQIDHDDAVGETIKQLLIDTWKDGKPWRGSASLNPDGKISLKNRENLVRTVVWYLDKFKNDPAKTKTANGRPLVELHFQFEAEQINGVTISLCGYLDRIVEFQGESFVMDHKTTTSTLGSHYFEQYDPDNQVSLYTVASQIAFSMPVRGVIIDASQIAVGFSRFVRHLIFKTPDQIDEWMHDLRYWLGQAQRFVDRGYWPMNDKSCAKFGGCPFREICSKSPSVRDKFLESSFKRHPWNPLVIR